MLLSYDGTSYSGWQIQPNAVSIQGSLEAALATLLKEEIRVVGAGRTDAGVHAYEQVAHFVTSASFAPERLQHSLNALLPKDIRIKELLPVPADFHAQISAEKKIYHYHLWLEPVFNPFLYRYRYKPKHPINLSLLQGGARLFEGTHDFTSFVNAGTHFRSAVRTIYRAEVVPQEGGVRLEVEGNGFLYKMVRNIMGMLLEVASGRRTMEDIPTLLAAKDRRQAPSAAPAQGLFLMKIFYKQKYSSKEEE